MSPLPYQPCSQSMTAGTEGDVWLYEAIRRAISENLCVKIGCTTCGASDFGSLLMMYMVRVYPDLRIAGKHFTNRHAEHLLAAIGALSGEQLLSVRRSEEVVRFLLYACWSALGGDEALPRMRNELKGAFVSNVFERMVRHEEGRRFDRALHEERSDPEKARLRREQRKLEKALRHEERKSHFRQLWLARKGRTLGGENT